MQQIHLSQNKVAVLDDEEFERLSRYHWCYRPERNGAQGYAIRHAREDGRYKTVYLHREIMKPPAGMEVIFLNHDRLDCRRQNLRVVDVHEARQHHRVRRDSKSGVKGVRYNPEYGTWSADIYRNDCCHRVGTYYTQEEAVEEYERALYYEHPTLQSAPALVERQVQPRTNVQEPALADVQQ
jgi:hypothetical protein